MEVSKANKISTKNIMDPANTMDTINAADAIDVLEPDMDLTCDIMVYGGTPAGISAAVQAARMEKDVILVETGRHVGGMMSSGLGTTDYGGPEAAEKIGGLAREFHSRVYKYYENDEAWIYGSFDEYRDYKFWRMWPAVSDKIMWAFEPHAAEKIFMDMLKEAGVKVLFSERLDLRKGIGVVKTENRISHVTMISGKKISAKVFLDCTYEGDLMALAGVSYTVGRESSDLYNEPLNGAIVLKQWQCKNPVDPYKIPGDPSSGLLKGIQDISGVIPGSGDRLVQAYNFRLCLTDVPKNRRPFRKPYGYDPELYELGLRVITTGGMAVLGNNQTMPNRKTDTNNGNPVFDTDFVGANYDYPEGDYETRRKIIEAHRTYQEGWFWFLSNDKRVPEHIRRKVGAYGLAKDEFIDNDNWPYLLYVREARRMIGRYVMTENDCRGTNTPVKSIGMGGNDMDSHAVRRFVGDDGSVVCDGFFIENIEPYPISYDSITPKFEECSNLLVPVCLSATHSAYGSIRMEPVFMILGQSAAVAAVLAADGMISVQEVEYTELRRKLLEYNQILG